MPEQRPRLPGRSSRALRHPARPGRRHLRGGGGSARGGAPGQTDGGLGEEIRPHAAAHGTAPGEMTGGGRSVENPRHDNSPLQSGVGDTRTCQRATRCLDSLV